MRDLSRVLYPPLPAVADELLAVWGKNWEGLGEKQANVDLIMVEIDNIRSKALLLLGSLE